MKNTANLTCNNKQLTSINDNSIANQAQPQVISLSKQTKCSLKQIIPCNKQVKGIAQQSQKQSLEIIQRYRTKYLQALLSEYDKDMLVYFKLLLNKNSDQILTKIIVQKQFFQIEKQRKLMFRFHLSEKCHLKFFFNYMWKNITYLNLTQCGINDKKWTQFVNNQGVYKYLKIIITDNNLITNFQQKKLLLFKSFRKLKHGKKLFQKEIKNESSVGKWLQCSEHPDKLKQFDIYSGYKSRQNYQHLLESSFRKRKRISKPRLEINAFKKPDFQQIDKENQHYEIQQADIISAISQKMTIINLMIIQNKKYGAKDIENFIDQSVGLNNKNDEKFIKIRSFKVLKSILSDIQQISIQLLQFVRITIFGPLQFYLQFKVYEYKVSKIQRKEEKSMKHKQNITKIKVPTSKLKNHQLLVKNQNQLFI